MPMSTTMFNEAEPVRLCNIEGRTLGKYKLEDPFSHYFQFDEKVGAALPKSKPGGRPAAPPSHGLVGALFRYSYGAETDIDTLAAARDRWRTILGHPGAFAIIGDTIKVAAAIGVAPGVSGTNVTA